MSPDHLAATISRRELLEQRLFYQLDPPLSERIDLVGGIIASTIANVNRGKNSKPFTPPDFMPLAEKPAPKRQRVTPAALKAALPKSRRKKA